MDYKTNEVKVEDLSNEKTERSIVSSLMYGSYSANRSYGMTHEQLISIGIGNDAMKAMYEQEVQQNEN